MEAWFTILVSAFIVGIGSQTWLFFGFLEDVATDTFIVMVTVFLHGVGFGKFR